ncbi:MAG: hypothetical protein QM760_07335 [Nibricoccus sp.]
MKGVGEQAAQKIIEERDKNGPYTDFDELVKRIDGRAINKRVLEHLTKTGAFDYSGASRKKLFDSIDSALAGAAAHAKDRAAGQHNMFDMLSRTRPHKKERCRRGAPTPRPKHRARRRRLHLLRTPPVRKRTPRLLRLWPPHERLRRAHRSDRHLPRQ